MITIHAMREEDIPRVMEIDRASFRSPWPYETYCTELQSPVSYLFVARVVDESPIAGYLGLWRAGDELHIMTVAVDTTHRRRGVGLRLMIHALEHGRKTGARRVSLEVRTSNKGARFLYASLGFAVTGVRTGYYQDTGEDAVLMAIPDLFAPECYVRIRRRREDSSSRREDAGSGNRDIV